ncbi:MAG: DegT/DnrJ/EryC1/StrS family aminotransferase [Terriglobia bacterium]|jgi:hypothetical protein
MRNTSLTRREFLETTSVGVAASVVPSARAATGNPNVLAVQGGTPVRSNPFSSWPQTNELDESNILKALRNHRWCTYDGEFIPQFEKAWAHHQGAGGCVMTPCGTHALHTALEVLEIQPGDEVLVAPFSFIADVAAIMLCYALPVFVVQTSRRSRWTRMTLNTGSPSILAPSCPATSWGRLPTWTESWLLPRSIIFLLWRTRRRRIPRSGKAKKQAPWEPSGASAFRRPRYCRAVRPGAMISNHADLIAKGYTFRDWGRPPK